MGKDPKAFLRNATSIPARKLERYRNRNRIGGNDIDDLYRFKIGDRSAIDLDVDKLRTNASVELFRFKRSGRAVNRAIGRSDFSALSRRDIRRNLQRVGRSKRRGKRPESIAKEIKSGSYVLRVFSDASRKGPYRLRLSITTPDDFSSGSSGTNGSGAGGDGTNGNAPGSNSPVGEGGAGGGNSDGGNGGGGNGGGGNGNAPSSSIFTQDWLRQFGSEQNDQGYAIALTDNQTIYLSGEFNASIDQITADAFLASYTSTGDQRWLESIGGVSNDRIDSLDLTPSGQVVGGGITSGEPSLQIGQSSNAYLVKYADDTEVFAIADSPSPSVTNPFINGGLDIANAFTNTVGLDVAVGSDGTIYQAGHSINTLGFPDLLDGFVTKYSDSGTFVGNIGLGLSGNDAAYGITGDANQNVYVTGFTNGTSTLANPRDLAEMLENGNPGALFPSQPFVMKVAPTGNQLWVQTIDSTDYGSGEDIAVDSAGNVYVSGVFSTDLAGNVGQGQLDAFVAKYDASGTRQWIKPIGTAGTDRARIAIDDRDRLIVAGYAGGSLFGNEYFGGTDAWLAHLDADGNVLGSTQFGTANNETLFGVDTDGTGNVYVTGSTDGSFGSDHLGGLDAWVAKYSVASST